MWFRENVLKSLLYKYLSRFERLLFLSLGKMEATTYAQTRNYIKPLLRMLKKQTLTDDIRDSLVQMVKATLERNYIASHER